MFIWLGATVRWGDFTCYRDKSPRPVAATEFCRCNLKLVLIRASDHSVCTLLRQVAATKFKSTNVGASIIACSYSPSSKFVCVHQASVLSQQQCRRQATCRRDVSHNASRPLGSNEKESQKAWTIEVKF